MLVNQLVGLGDWWWLGFSNFMACTVLCFVWFGDDDEICATFTCLATATIITTGLMSIMIITLQHSSSSSLLLVGCKKTWRNEIKVSGNSNNLSNKFFYDTRQPTTIYGKKLSRQE